MFSLPMISGSNLASFISVTKIQVFRLDEFKYQSGNANLAQLKKKITITYR